MPTVRVAAVLTVTAVLGLAGVGTAQAKAVPGQTSWLSKTSGTITVNGDGSRSSTLAVAPAVLTVKRLDRLGWKDRDPMPEPHLWVFTTDPAQVLGRTIDDGRPCGICDTAKAEMAAALSADPTVTRVEHGLPGGLDVTGDAYLDRVDDDVWVRVLAPAGTDFYYLDAYHPWVHAQVHVTA